jgi:hypothetical protein
MQEPSKYLKDYAWANGGFQAEKEAIRDRWIAPRLAGVPPENSAPPRNPDDSPVYVTDRLAVKARNLRGSDVVTGSSASDLGGEADCLRESGGPTRRFFALRGAAVLVVEPTEHRHGKQIFDRTQLSLSRHGRMALIGEPPEGEGRNEGDPSNHGPTAFEPAPGIAAVAPLRASIAVVLFRKRSRASCGRSR